MSFTVEQVNGHWVATKHAPGWATVLGRRPSESEAWALVEAHRTVRLVRA